MTSNLVNFVSLDNQTVTQNLTGAYSSITSLGYALSNLSLESVMMAGATTTAATEYTAGQLDDILSGSERFDSSERNSGSSLGSIPESTVADKIKDNTNGTVIFPSDTPPYYMTFNFFKYKRPSQFGTTTFDPIGEKILLPLPDGQGLVDNSQANWTESSLGLAGNALDSLKNADQYKAAFKKDGPAGGIANVGTEAALVLAIKLSAVLPSELGLGDVAGTIESQFGAVENPGAAQLFKGVGMRQFSFTWTFAPKNVDESNNIKKIIDIFKRNHLPTFMAAGGSFMFNYPNIVHPSYGGLLDQSTNQYLPTFEYCAISEVNVSYSPQGVAPSFYAKSKAPVFIQLSITLKELNIRLGDKYGGKNIGAGAYDNLKGQVAQALGQLGKDLAKK